MITEGDHDRGRGDHGGSPVSGHPEPPTSALGRWWDAALIRVATAVLRRGSPWLDGAADNLLGYILREAIESAQRPHGPISPEELRVGLPDGAEPPSIHYVTPHPSWSPTSPELAASEMERRGALDIALEFRHLFATGTSTMSTHITMEPAVRTTIDPDDPQLTHDPDTELWGQTEVYPILSDAERAKDFVRPLRESYRHISCLLVTNIDDAIAATFARDPAFYSSTYCAWCNLHSPVGERGEFEWLDGSKVGT